MIMTIFTYLGITIGTVMFFCIYFPVVINLGAFASDLCDKGGKVNKFFHKTIMTLIVLSVLGIIALPFIFMSFKALLFTGVMIALSFFVLYIIGENWR